MGLSLLCVLCCKDTTFSRNSKYFAQQNLTFLHSYNLTQGRVKCGNDSLIIIYIIIYIIINLTNTQK